MTPDRCVSVALAWWVKIMVIGFVPTASVLENVTRPLTGGFHSVILSDGFQFSISSPGLNNR